MNRIPHLLLLLFSLATVSLVNCRIAGADARLPGFFGDHMVLQQEKEIRIWGWAEPAEKVTVSLGDSIASTTTPESGRWEVRLPAMKASHQPMTLQIDANNQLTLSDVLIGEVWLCSGQSNMEWTVRSSANAKQEIAAGTFPLIRHIKVPRKMSTTPKEDIVAPWQACSPDTVGNFSAAGYFMARHLHQELDVPIGLINSSWGGTRVEPWTPPNGFESVEQLQAIHQSVVSRTPGSPEYQAAISRHIEQTEQWLQQAAEAAAAKQAVPANPAFPASMTPFKSHQDPTMLYNAMIHALVGFPIRGAIWYQGESNHNDGMQYAFKKEALINGWRQLWGQGDFPFYYVQIAPFQYGKEDPTILAKFWEAQQAVKRLPNTDMVVINDIATLNNIHPPNKQDVGKRLALLALKNQYGKAVIAGSPEADEIKILDDKITIQMKNTGGGLKTRDGAAPTHFEIIGIGSKGFKPANAVIRGDVITLTSSESSKLTGFRFAWDKLAEPNLIGGTGQPVGAFRGGTEPDLVSLMNIDDSYQLVYDIDLSKLNANPEYDIDKSDRIGEFERVGYLVELRGDAGSQAVFVSMDAFTSNAKQIGIPTAESGASFQQTVSNLSIFGRGVSLASGEQFNGSIEFWPNNYGPANTAKVPGATNNRYDTGDQKTVPKIGYGSMQVHNTTAKQTVFAINHWKAGSSADIGIGNGTGEHSDWTFSGNAHTYQVKRLRVYVQ